MSIAAVASSSMTILDFLKMALHIQTKAFSPEDKFAPSYSI
jgi:hypothetical protein